MSWLTWTVIVVLIFFVLLFVVIVGRAYFQVSSLLKQSYNIFYWINSKKK